MIQGIQSILWKLPAEIVTKNMMKLEFKFHIFMSLWCWFSLTKPGFSAHILGVFTILSRSHFIFNEEIMLNLAEAGHQITMIGPFSLSQPYKNVTIINSEIKRTKDELKQMSSAMRLENSAFTNHVNGRFYVVDPDCRRVMAMEEVKNLKNSYDIFFLELFPMYQCFLPLAKRLNAPIIGTLAHRSHSVLDYSAGNSRNPAVIPEENTFLSEEMTFLERLSNLFAAILNEVVNFIENKLLEKFFNDLTEYPKDNLDNTSISLIFSNDHHVFVPRPMAENVIAIGGIGLKSKHLNALPKDLENFIHEAKHGVILFSLGTLFQIDTLSPEIIIIIKKAFARIPQRIIWKWDSDIEGISDNVLIRKWIPQKEILAHKNVVAFISHCGLNSIYESIYFGKPLILLPLFHDQRGNAGILSSLEVGIYLNLLKLSEEAKLLDAVEEVLANPK